MKRYGTRYYATFLNTSCNTVAVMTRLSYAERQVLDTLIAANVVKTRSAALSYIVRTFATEHQDWLDKVEEAAKHMASLRTQLYLQPRGEPPHPDSSSDQGETSL